MLTLKQAKGMIFKTDCQDYVYEGLICSEPILSLGKEGLVDNYFVYSKNKKKGLISKPIIQFGIYSDLCKMAYAKEINKQGVDEYIEDEKKDVSLCNERFLEYETLYPVLRNFAFKQCNNEQRQSLSSYLYDLEYFSGPGLWHLYKQLVPNFFIWASEQLKDI